MASSTSASSEQQSSPSRSRAASAARRSSPRSRPRRARPSSTERSCATRTARSPRRRCCASPPTGDWNRHHIRLDGGELTLEVNGVVQNCASWCDEVPGKICLQSEGAVIEFRKVNLPPIQR
ncbi:MAG: family 16 glycoside hydrolase [Rhodoglobus sp.]